MMTDEERARMNEAFNTKAEAQFRKANGIRLTEPAPTPTFPALNALTKQLDDIEKNLAANERINMFTFISMFMSGVVMGFIIRGWL